MLGSERIQALARECGFEIAGVAPAEPPPEARWYHRWAASGMAGGMGYLTDHRAVLREDPRNLLPSVRSIVCAGKLYNGPEPRTSERDDGARAWISRYAWGDDYHGILRRGMEALAARMRAEAGCGFDYRVAVDTAPLLERALARRAGLGWIGRNGCLIHERKGSWFFLAEMLVSLELAPGAPAADRCGACTRCIEACPTRAIVRAPAGEGPEFTLDARLCIAYLTIERRGPFSGGEAAAIGRHVFGCDICQDVCPWNNRAAVTTEPGFAARQFAPPLERLAEISEREFLEMFRHSPVRRARYSGFLRNVAAAMGNAGLPRFRAPLERLAASRDGDVAAAAREAMERLAPRAAPLQGASLQEQQEAGKDNQDRLSGHTLNRSSGRG